MNDDSARALIPRRLSSTKCDGAAARLSRFSENSEDEKLFKATSQKLASSVARCSSATLQTNRIKNLTESICPFRTSGRRCAGPHDPEECVDVVALDGISAGGNHLVLGFPHWVE